MYYKEKNIKIIKAKIILIQNIQNILFKITTILQRQLKCPCCYDGFLMIFSDSDNVICNNCGLKKNLS